MELHVTKSNVVLANGALHDGITVDQCKMVTLGARPLEFSYVCLRDRCHLGCIVAGVAIRITINKPIF
jgi:hypothetical protein